MDGIFKNTVAHWFKYLTIVILWIYPTVSFRERVLHDSIVSLHFDDIGDYSHILDHPFYGQVLKKTQTWLDYENPADVKTCALQTTFEFNLDLHNRFVEEIFLNVSCLNITEWIRQNWIMNSKKLEMCWKGKENSHCVLAVAVKPPKRCQHKDTDPVVKYFGHTQKDMAIFEELSFCGEGEFGYVSIMGHLRDHLSCRTDAGPYVVRMDIIIADFRRNSSCLPSFDVREDVLQDLERNLPNKDTMVKLSTQLVETCPHQLYCRDKTCYRPTDECNFQLECVGGEDESRCWCSAPKSKNISSSMISSFGPSALTENGLICDFEPVGTGIDEYCEFCSWGHGNFKISSGTSRNDTIFFPLTDATEMSPRGHFIFASYNTNKQPGQKPFLLSTCIGSSGPNCILRFHYVVYGRSGKEHIKVVRLPTCQHLPGGDEIYDLVKITNHNGIRWKSHAVHVGKHDSPFRLAITAILHDATSIVAIDGLEFHNCRADLDSLITCSNDEFQCATHKCIKRDLMCNIVEDCSCGEDEKHEDCARIPNYGKTSFDDCNLDSGSCWWHNDGEGSDFKWTVEGERHSRYVNVNTAHRKPSEIAILNSVYYAPTSKDNMQECKVRFFVHKSGNDVYRLDLVLKEDNSEDKRISRIHFTDYQKNKWYYLAVPIGNVSQRYMLQFKAFAGLHGNGNISISSISLSPECFSGPRLTQEISDDFTLGKGSIGHGHF